MLNNLMGAINAVRGVAKEHKLAVRIVGGILIFAGISVMAAYGEDRVTNIEKNLVETREVSPENEGKLVIVSGTPSLENDGVLVDEAANLQVNNAINYYRQPLQKVLVEKSREIVVDKGEDKISERDDIKKTEYYAEYEWIPSGAERKAVVYDRGNNYDNPEPVEMEGYSARNEVLLGEFALYDYADALKNGEIGERRFTEEELANNCKDYIDSLGSGFQVVPSNWKGYGAIANGNELGDIRIDISYRTLDNPKPITVIGRQEGKNIIFDDTFDLEKNEHVFEGTKTKAEYIKELSGDDTNKSTGGRIALIIGVIAVLITLGKSAPKDKRQQFMRMKV